METQVEAWPGLCLETPRLHLSVSAQMSGVCGQGGPLWEPCSPLSGLLWPSQGSLLRSGSQSVPRPDSPSLGLLETPQVGYLVIISIFQHIQVQ